MRFGRLMALALALLGGACQFVPAAEVDQARAIEIAKRHAGAVDALVEARLMRVVDDPDAVRVRLPSDRLVWRVSFSASQVRQCGPAPGDHRCRIDSKTVIIDATSGDVITSSESGATVP